MGGVGGTRKVCSRLGPSVVWDVRSPYTEDPGSSTLPLLFSLESVELWNVCIIIITIAITTITITITIITITLILLFLSYFPASAQEVQSLGCRARDGSCRPVCLHRGAFRTASWRRPRP